MPLTEASKPKVSLASISATAAESLWSRSKKSSKRRQKSIPTSISAPAEVASSNPSTSPLIITTTQSQIPKPIQQQPPLDQSEFRRKFLEGLQFYCENSSLILNSDLPADLIEFVTAHGFSVESLGIILELKKSSSAFSAYDKKPLIDNSVVGTDRHTREQKFSEISRRLLQHWMSADSCAEAFVSLSLGEEIPGLIAECNSFQRVLFAVPENFHLNGEDFLSFLLPQVLLTIRTLVYGLRDTESSNEHESIKIRSQVIGTFLDRAILRNFSDGQHFYGTSDGTCERSSFQDFVIGLSELCNDDIIVRRLVSKVLLHLSSQSATKLTKTIFSTKKHNNTSVASVILWPAYEFLERSSQWRFILQNLPVKTVSKSKSFWLRWAEYVAKEPQNFTKVWLKTVDQWIVLNKSRSVNEHSLYSATLAVTALAKQVKFRIQDDEINKEEVYECIRSLEPGKVLQNIVHSLESINENKRACGMALGQLVADLQFSLPITNSDETSKNTEAPGKMKFECKIEMFSEIINFYEAAVTEDYDGQVQPTKGAGVLKTLRKIQVLDSDDDDDNTEPNTSNDDVNDGFPILGDDDNDVTNKHNSKVGIDSRILTLRARKTKIPMYFSELVETLLEKAKNEDEAEILQYIVLLKIPVLLFNGVRIDAQMATTITKCVVDIEDTSSLEVPIIFGLYELFLQHPFEVSDALGEVVFDRNRYALGQRLMNLERLTQIVQLSSKQSCYNCYFSTVKKNEMEYLGIYPEFINKYLYSRQKLRFCQGCRISGSGNLPDQDDASSASRRDGKDDPLTWRQIVDRRVAAKTRYFVTPRSKTVVTVPDDYSSKQLPILWSSIANRLTSSTAFYMNKEERLKTGNMHDLFLVRVFQYLAKCIMGTSGPNCLHIRSVSSHAGELVSNYSMYEDPIVRRTVLSLLGVILSVGEGKIFVIEALSSQGNVLQIVDQLAKVEDDHENQKFIGHIQKFLASCTTTGLLTLSNLGLE